MRSRFYLPHALSSALRALLIVCAACGQVQAQKARPLTAILLQARDELADADFADSLVLVLNNLGPAPVGLIVNRPTEVPVSRLFPDLKPLATLPDKLYFGGPVEFTSVWFLFRAVKTPEHAIQAFEGVCLSADRQLLLRLLTRDKPMDGLRIFVGHSGWAPGQLEAEIESGAWTLRHASAEAVFGDQSQHPWPAPQGPKSST